MNRYDEKDDFMLDTDRGSLKGERAMKQDGNENYGRLEDAIENLRKAVALVDENADMFRSRLTSILAPDEPHPIKAKGDDSPGGDSTIVNTIREITEQLNFASQKNNETLRRVQL